MTTDIKIEDDFLSQEEFNTLKELMMSGHISWFLKNMYYGLEQGDESPEDLLDRYQFVHPFYDAHAPQSPLTESMNPILDKLNPVSLFKIIAVLCPRLTTIIENPFHSDMEELPEEQKKQWTTSIFYVNTNNGHTVFEDGTKIESVANRLITFPTNMKHTGTNCTDENARIVINFNYFESNLIKDTIL